MKRIRKGMFLKGEYNESHLSRLRQLDRRVNNLNRDNLMESNEAILRGLIE